MLRVAHRHSAFTIPDTLRNYFYSRRDLLKELQDGVYDVINYWYSKNNPNYEVGVIAVIHTFGSDLKWNPHVHDLATEGAIDKGSALIVMQIFIIQEKRKPKKVHIG